LVSETQYAGFLDLLYGAAVDPGEWERVIATFADMIGGARAWMPDISVANGSGRGVVARIDPAAQATYFQYYAKRNPFVRLVIDNPKAAWPLNVRTDEHQFPKDELVRTEYFNDFLRPQEIHSCLVVRLGRSDGVVSTLNIGRPRHREQFNNAELELARRLHPDLIRAFNLSRKFADLGAFAAGMAETFERSSHGVLLLDDKGRIRHANTIAERLLKEAGGLCVAGGRLSACQSEPARQLGALIDRAARRQGSARAGGSMALPTPTRALPLSLTIAPLRSERLLAGAEAPSVLVCVTDLEAGVSLPVERLRELFGLTPAEARVALAVFEGLAPKDIAERFGVSHNTIQVQLARIFEKTGVNRQTDLVRLMMRAAGVNLGAA
jgi:DNA-binding CsgD family transcriptional regulator/PAS domain-containing protein